MALQAQVPPRVLQPSSQLDLSHRLEAPAGQRGFLFAGSDGHFYFPDGTRMRFWGINVAKRSVFQPREIVDRAADAFAHAGINLVRLHHLDDVCGLLPPQRAGQAQRIDPQRLDELDYWIHALRSRGIYVWIDLLSYRTFHEVEGVPNAAQLGRGAKPVAFFSERLIELQMEFARQLLVEHVNPYTGLRYRDDPAICAIEICDEHGMIATRNRWAAIPSPYREELIRRWNYWLRQRYRDTAALGRVWTLAPFEQLETGGIALPGVSPDREEYAGREPEVLRFAASLEREYLAQMTGRLRSMGVRAPITAVTDYTSPASVLAAADTLDFVSGNYYFAHPVYRDTAPPDVRFFYKATNAVADTGPDTAVRRLCGPRVAGKPLVIREWNVCWPNAYRAPGLLEAAALAAVQDLDGMILFAYYTEPEATALGPFDVSNDPTTWGMTALAGEVFRQTQAARDRPRAAVLWDEQSIYGAAPDALGQPIYDAGKEIQVENWFPGHTRPAADIYALVSSRARGLLPEEARPEVTLEVDAAAGWGDGLPLLLGQWERSRSLLSYSPRDAVFSFSSGPVRVLAGRVATERVSPQGDLRWGSSSVRSALVWLSLDGEPPATSRRWVAKMVAGAWNRGEVTRPHFVRADYNIFALVNPGGAPVDTGGKPAPLPTTLTLGDRMVLRLWMRGGVWELHSDGESRRLYCDTPDIRFEFPDLPDTTALTAHTPDGHVVLAGPPWIYPEGALKVEASCRLAKEH